MQSLNYSFPEFKVFMEVFNLLFMLMFLAHIAACAFYATAVAQPECRWAYPGNSCLMEAAGCRGTSWGSGVAARALTTTSSTTWWEPQPQDAADNAAQGTLYSAAIYWSFTTLTTIGYGDILPTNNLERAICTLTMVAGSGMFAYIVGRLAAVASQVNYRDMVIQSKSERMEQYMVRSCIVRRSAESLRKSARSRERSSCRFGGTATKAGQRRCALRVLSMVVSYVGPQIFDESEQLGELSATLRRQLGIHINRKILSTCPIFKGKQGDGEGADPTKIFRATCSTTSLPP